MPPFADRLRQFWTQLTGRQRLTLGATVLGAAVLLGAVAYWASRPDYALLFGKLDAADANRIVEALREENVPFDLREGGTAVHVPRAQVYELRLRFAGEGVASDGPVGYELFDGGTLGMTDFMQKLNYKRALEGELSRTITSVGQVEQARVHLVLPERSAFRERQANPSASVVLRLKGGAGLTPAQVEGITALVSGAVEGMTPAEVTVLDTRGNLLSRPDAGDPDAALSSGQVRAQRAVEEHLAEGGQTLLDRMLGPGKAVLRVSAALDFSKTVQERDAVEPNATALLSEEQSQDRGEFDQSTTSVKNYEVSRTKTRSERGAGVVRALTVSVILDHKRVPGAKPEAPATYKPLTQYELDSVEALVKNAVGFNAERGDQITVRQARFDTSIDDDVTAELREQADRETWAMYVRYGLMALALIAAALVLRSALRRATALPAAPALPATAEPAGVLEAGDEPRTLASGEAASGDGALLLPAAEDVYERKLSDEARAHLADHPDAPVRARAYALDHPDATAALLREWIAEDAAV